MNVFKRYGLKRVEQVSRFIFDLYSEEEWMNMSVKQRTRQERIYRTIGSNSRVEYHSLVKKATSLSYIIKNINIMKLRRISKIYNTLKPVSLW